jgi:hypothetical protein
MSSNPLIHTFINEAAIQKWRKCCNKAADCCREMIETMGIHKGKYAASYKILELGGLQL